MARPAKIDRKRLDKGSLNFIVSITMTIDAGIRSVGNRRRAIPAQFQLQSIGVRSRFIEIK